MSPNVVVFLTDQQRWDTTGLPVPKEMQGRSAVPLLHDRKAVWGDDVFVQVSESETARAVRTQRWKYGVVAPDCDPSAAGSDHYVEAYLFDLMADPYELDNLVGYRSHTHVAARLRERLINRMTDAGEAPPTIAVSPERDSGQRHIEPAEADL